MKISDFYKRSFIGKIYKFLLFSVFLLLSFHCIPEQLPIQDVQNWILNKKFINDNSNKSVSSSQEIFFKEKSTGIILITAVVFGKETKEEHPFKYNIVDGKVNINYDFLDMDGKRAVWEDSFEVNKDKGILSSLRYSKYENGKKNPIIYVLKN
jgi:hypothetical protein